MASCSFSPRAVRFFILSFLTLAFTSAAVAAPNAPTYLAAYAYDATNVVLLWNDNSTDETGFEVQYNTGGGWATATVEATNATYTVLGTPAGFSAQYQVRATNGSGNSAFSPIVTCTQATFNAPGSLNGLVNKESVMIT
ncbi:MAG: fibronectin type III domain-containing protein, partial [Prosthecobacter sp.]|uniref:fibronectin type III domain-containing protein n=1 Tax=Prosthecobacter sp. TaxID=1965333 RepID=UPI003BB05FC7